ncbi:MAG TPA: hypothetical protein VGZ48_15420 [Candidatus Acidoferrales bacterium]|jgi:hypothetical protein|nr:hypothetical protein [Candidatus Acidoferrales bacterium]
MRKVHAAAAVCAATAGALIAMAQGSPPLRVLRAGRVEKYQIELRVRSEVEGQKPTTIGAKTYVQPVSEWVEQRLTWMDERRLISAGADGATEIEERLADFSGAADSSGSDPQTIKLLEGLKRAIEPWEAARTLRYRETRAGQIAGLEGAAAPPLEEPAPRVLTAWLLRALRPTAALPAHALVYNQSWEEPRAVRFAEWSETTGSESGEWLGGTAGMLGRGEPTVQLHTTQEIAGSVAAGSEKPTDGEAQAHFHAESLSTLALEDLRLMSATRSALREIVWTLAPVEGLEKPPQFRGRLLAEIHIKACDETPCTNHPGGSGGNR